MKIMIIRPGALGDTLMLAPSLAQVRLSEQVLFVGRYPAIDFLKVYTEECFNYEGPGWHGLFMEEPGEKIKPLIAKPSLVVAFLRDPEHRAAENLKLFFPGIPVHIFPPFPPEGEKKHVALYLAECLQRAGCRVNPTEALEKAVTVPLLEAKSTPSLKSSVVFHPGSGGKDKNYSLDFWVELIMAFSENRLFSTKKKLLLLGPAEGSAYPLLKEKLGRKGVEFLLSPESETLLSLLGSATLYIGHDSGITHLSAMLGTLTVALFRNTNVFRWRPLGPSVIVLQKQEGSGSLVRDIVAKARRSLSEPTNAPPACLT
ncbi:MAG: glycosyltransferase family 9 protein [Deltaproteobacteria bacterium]|nr:glycosyltransferase family 9 protein [Deltaproteobacteria bacterium]